MTLIEVMKAAWLKRIEEGGGSMEECLRAALLALAEQTEKMVTAAFIAGEPHGVFDGVSRIEMTAAIKAAILAAANEGEKL